MLCRQGVTASRRARLPNVLACRQTHCPSNSLTYAELIGSRRQGQSIICTASYDRMGGLLGFLMEDCCEGASEICALLAEVVNLATFCAAENEAAQS